MRLGRAGLVAWLLTPVAIVGGLALLMDRSRGRAHFESAAPREVLPVSSSAQPAQPVQPESLAQGFIIVVEDKSQVASAASPIFLASSHNGWNPGDPDRKLTQRSDGRWQIALPKPRLDSRIAFKFARGDWDHVEVAADLKDIENRLLPPLDPATIKPGEPPVIELIIEKWADMRGGGGGPAPLPEVYREISVAGGSIQRVQVIGGWSDGFVRDVIVWLPPGYDNPANAARRYPVLYMQDGQNLFHKHDGIPAEWQVDETATRLIAEKKIEPLIVVGIPHAGPQRATEYLPIRVEALKDVEPRGAQYVEFLLHEVLPRIERAFRARTGPENTAIGGSSLGGLISLYTGATHPEVFGKVLAESPSLVIGGKELWRDAFGKSASVSSYVFLGMGGKEWSDDRTADNERLVKAVQDVRQWSLDRAAGAGAGGQVRLLIENDAHHNEQAWAGRLAQALEFLFPGPKR